MPPESAAVVGSFINQVGFPVAVVCFFLYRDWRQGQQVIEREKASRDREERMAGRITTLEQMISEDLSKALTDAVKVIERNTAVMARLEPLLERVGRNEPAR